MQLKPREYFPIVRQLRDPFDSNTYYIQAKIRNENTDELIDTVNLSDKGSQLFVSRWQIPPDTSGEGFWISIETIVYTDSGYTTKAENYERNRDTYLVFDRSIKLGGGGSGGGADISYKKIKEIVSEVIDEKEKAKQKAEGKKEKEPEEKPKPVNLEPIMQSLKAISLAIGNIEKPKEVKFDGVLETISNSEKIIRQAIADKEVTGKTDLEPVIEMIKKLEDYFKNLNGLLGFLEMLPEIKKTLANVSVLMPEMENGIKDFIYLGQKNGMKKRPYLKFFEIKE